MRGDIDMTRLIQMRQEWARTAWQKLAMTTSSLDPELVFVELVRAAREHAQVETGLTDPVAQAVVIASRAQITLARSGDREASPDLLFSRKDHILMARDLLALACILLETKDMAI